MQFLAWGPSLGQQDWERTKNVFKIIFQFRVAEVCLILCNELEEHLCNFWLKKKQKKIQHFLALFQLFCPKENSHAKKCILLCVYVLLRITLLCSGPVHKVWDFERRRDRFSSSSNIILRVQKWYSHLWNIFSTVGNWHVNVFGWNGSKLRTKNVV